MRWHRRVVGPPGAYLASAPLGSLGTAPFLEGLPRAVAGRHAAFRLPVAGLALALVAVGGLARAAPAVGGVDPLEPWRQAAVSGRFIAERVGASPRLRAGWPGVALDIAFSGGGLAVCLGDVPGLAAAGLPDAPGSVWEVRVDDGPGRVVMAPARGGAVRLATGLPAGSHRVRLIRRTDGMVPASWVWNLAAEPGGRLLPPPPRRARRMEVYGASTETGYGAESHNCRGYRPTEQNQNLAWPQRLADQLGAELMNTSLSGKGISLNLPGAGGPETTLPRLAARSDPGDSRHPWDFSAWQADVVVIGLGGNDWSGYGGPPPEGIFEDALVAFVQSIREHYPKAQVWVALAAGFEPPARGRHAKMLRAVVRRMHAIGDQGVHFFAFARDRTPATQRACDAHVSAAQHGRMAAELAPIVRAALNW